MEIQNEQNKSVTMQIRADEQTKEQFAEICKSLGMTQGAAMQALISAYELDAAKAAIKGSADIIDDVRSHSNAILTAVTLLLEHNQSTDERIRQEYSAKLESLQTALEQAQKQAQTAQETAAQAQAALDAVKEQAAQEQLQATAQVAEYADKADRAEQARQIAEKFAEDARRTADTVSARVKELTEERDLLRADAKKADSLIEELTKAKTEITRLETAAEVAAAKAETAKAQAVADAERAMQGKLDEIRNVMQNKLDAEQTKRDELRDRLETMQELLQKVTAERDELARKSPQQTKSN